jgi:SAM-dependent methyltransferase
MPRSIYIWGTGQVGRDALRRLRGRVAGFVDNDAEKWHRRVDGLEVVPPAEVLDTPSRPFIVIASMYEDAIAAQLCAAARTRGVDFASVASVVDGDDHPADVFSRIFHGNAWSDGESRSGGGSSLAATEPIRTALPGLLRRLGVRSVVDAACGDLCWMATLLPVIEDYTGVEIVPELVERNRRRYGSSRVRFVHRDISIEPCLPERLDAVPCPPAADLVICRDCLVHLPTPLAMRALRNIATTGAGYLLTTTFPRTSVNRDVLTGAWRPLNLERTPFQLGPPLASIAEYPAGSDDPFADKALALWALDDVRAALGI